ncbi:MAG TPA: methylmalonyl-CoA mutase family protein, partial [Thermoanaerobaculia bacterium]
MPASEKERRDKARTARPEPPAETGSGIRIQPWYGQPAPGEYPFTRGISQDGYRDRYWTMRQYAGYGS